MDSEIKMTMEQARKQMEIFRQLFHEVRLLNASDLGVEAGDSGSRTYGRQAVNADRAWDKKALKRRVLREKF